MVVEDEAFVRRLMRTVLESKGYAVLEAPSGAAALEMMGSLQHIGLFVTDVMLPDTMTGVELAARPRQDRLSLKVVCTSGQSAESVTPRLTLQEGVNFAKAVPACQASVWMRGRSAILNLKFLL